MSVTSPLAGGPREAVDLVAVQEGAIVSCIVRKEHGGSVTAFAFDAGQSLNEHTVPHAALIYVHEGRVHVAVGGTAHTVRAGEMIELPPNVPHALDAPEPCKLLLTILKT